MMAMPLATFIAAATTGALLRLVASLVIAPPWSNLTVNLLGSVLIGFLYVYLENYSSATKTIVFVAFLGSLTTYSGFAIDCVKLMNQGAWKTLASYLVLSNSLCVLGCATGWQIAKKLLIKF